jgi:Tol biopolymer transport system component
MNGVEGNQNSFAPAISADGKSVAFESYATNLVPIDSNNVRDVFVWNYDKSTVTAVSDAPGGIEANSEAFEPSISGDGRFIVFSSSASTLTSGVDGTSTVNLFLKDMQSGTVTLISRDPKTGKGGGGSRGSISEDGSQIAFYNYFPLTSDDKNTLWDIYVWDRGNPKLKRISLTAGGMERDQGTESSSRVITPAISGNGRFVTFATTAKNMFLGDSNGLQDAFMVEIDTGKVSPLSFVNGNFGNGDSPVGQGEKIPITFDGNQVIFTSKAANLGGSLLIQNLTEGTSLRVVTPKKNADGVEFSIGVPAISRTGKCVVFGSNIKLDKRFPSSGIFVTCFGN